jgi:hypothetical protein
MRRFAGILGALALVASVTIAAGVQGATKAQRSRAAKQMVEEALQQEVQGTDSKRAELLQAALNQKPDDESAHWHSGYVQWNHKWFKYDQLPEMLDGDLRLIAYQRQRERQPDTVEGQMAMANWCADRKLEDQRRAHLNRVLQLDPNCQEARRLLGFERVGGVWLTPQEVDQAVAQSDKTAAAVRQWKPKLEEIRDGLVHRSQQVRDKAKERLLAIKDPAAIPAMEQVLVGGNETLALHFIDALAGLSGNEAAVALARLAVLQPTGPVGSQATEKLKARKFETYVPVLLASMVTPIQAKAQVYQAPSGRLIYQQILVSENQGQRRVAVRETEYRGSASRIRGPADLNKSAVETSLADARLKTAIASRQVTQQNTTIDQINRRICTVLAMTTNQNVPASPEEWWKWWNEYNETFLDDEKPTEGSYNRDEVVVRQTGGSPSTLECLVAGTPIWTALGAVAVEKIKVGDQVLAQDPKTGELAYKPVLRTTVRSAAKLIRIHVGQEVVQCSGGHPFWVCGEGWVKARDLRAGMLLHAVHGTAEVSQVQEEGFARTYNLVVADLHSYFVGPKLIFSHDNTIRQPSDLAVPGLLRP